MKPCANCGRVNPAEATYCMTCGAALKDAPKQEQRPWDRFTRADRAREEPRAQTTQSDARAEPRQEPRTEKVVPLVEDFAWDVVRAGAKLYFGVRDPEGPPPGARRKSSPRDRVERLKDVIAEARVGHRRRGDPRDDTDRTRY